MTLFRVLNDNRKSIERRIIPLLEMFKVETAFFKELQISCLNQIELANKGTSKVPKKIIEEFEENYKKTDEEEIIKLQKAIETLMKQVNLLKTELEMIKIKQDLAGKSGDYRMKNDF